MTIPLATIRRMMSDPAEFRRRLVIDTSRGPKPLATLLDPWQRADFEATDPGWRRCVGLPVTGECRQRAYLERPRGHSKTADIAVMATWALFASRRPRTGNVCANDRDQAMLVRAAIVRLLKLNPWLERYIDIQRWRIFNPLTKSEMLILASDGASGYGQTPDFIICDELTHWVGVKGQDLWTAMFSASAKRENSMLVIISNAGTGRGKTWQWRAREGARTSPRWHFSRLDGVQASWIHPEDLEEQRAMLPASAYRRLWENQWTTDSGDALPIEEINACVSERLEAGMLDEGMVCLGGLDLGIKKDHAALEIVGVVPGADRVRLIESKSWAPPKGGQVEVQEIEDTVLELHRKYRLAWLGFDPHQALYLAQRLARRDVPMQEVKFVGANLDTMARELMTAFRHRRLEMFFDEKLLDDLTRLCIVQRRYGYKLEAVADETGHADRATALAIVLPAALDLAVQDVTEEDTREANTEYRVAV